MQDIYEANVEGVRIGEVLAGKYRIERVLGMGGMGVVVAARHLQLDELVAIKYLIPAALEHPTAVSRFIREAKAAVRIKSEHVARVSDVGTLDGGTPYLVMEYLEGQDLAQWLRQSGPMAVAQVVEFVLQALEAIADAHGLGIIHRDLKPANLFCVRRSDGILSIKVLDFGISKTSDLCAGELGAITAPAAIMGSPLYMSPEQMRSARDVDVRTDIWAIGVILYQLVTGEAPFVGQTISEICEKATSLAPALPRSLRPDLALEFEAVILKCLEKDRNRRYSNVAELAIDLLPFAPKRARASVERISRIISATGILPSATELVPPSEAQPTALQSQTDGNFGHTQKTRVQLGRRGTLGVMLALLGAAVAVVIWLIGSGNSIATSPGERVANSATILVTQASAGVSSALPWSNLVAPANASAPSALPSNLVAPANASAPSALPGSNIVAVASSMETASAGVPSALPGSNLVAPANASAPSALPVPPAVAASTAAVPPAVSRPSVMPQRAAAKRPATIPSRDLFDSPH